MRPGALTVGHIGDVFQRRVDSGVYAASLWHRGHPIGYLCGSSLHRWNQYHDSYTISTDTTKCRWISCPDYSPRMAMNAGVASVCIRQEHGNLPNISNSLMCTWFRCRYIKAFILPLIAYRTFIYCLIFKSSLILAANLGRWWSMWKLARC